jgi:hypothetical protein
MSLFLALGYHFETDSVYLKVGNEILALSTFPGKWIIVDGQHRRLGPMTKISFDCMITGFVIATTLHAFFQIVEI